MPRLAAACVVAALGCATLAAKRPTGLKALVGGTLIDGFGGRPIRNSVILIDRERITAVGQVGTLQAPAGAEIISTEGNR